MEYKALMNAFLVVLDFTSENGTYHKTIETFQTDYGNLPLNKQKKYLNYLKQQFDNYSYQEFIQEVYKNPYNHYDMRNMGNEWKTSKKKALDTIQNSLTELGLKIKQSKSLTEWGYKLTNDNRKKGSEEPIDTDLKKCIKACYNKLNGKFIDCEFDNFMGLFDPYSEFPAERKIKWVGDAQDLHYFIKQLGLRNKIENKGQKWQIAAHCFVNYRESPATDFNHTKLSEANGLNNKGSIILKEAVRELN